MVKIKNVFTKAVMATANTVQQTARQFSDDDSELRSKISEQMQRLRQDLSANLLVSHSAQAMARWGAKRLAPKGIGRAVHGLAKRPILASGLALWTFDAVGDGLKVRRGELPLDELFLRGSANAGGLAASAGGTALGGLVGGLILPVVGAPIGGLVGGVAASGGGASLGRKLGEKVFKKQDGKSAE